MMKLKKHKIIKEKGAKEAFDDFKSGEVFNRAFKNISRSFSKKVPYKQITKKKIPGCESYIHKNGKWFNFGCPGAMSYDETARHAGLRGSGLDIHKAIGNLPKPKRGWTLPGHKYTGPYNDLEKQVKYDKNTGKILQIYDKPTGMTNQQVRLMLLQCNMMLITQFVAMIKR